MSDVPRSVVIPEGYCLMPTRLTAENGAKGLLSGEFHLESVHICHECDGDDETDPECDVCGGEGEYTNRHQITWDDLKDIYNKAVSGLSIKQG